MRILIMYHFTKLILISLYRITHTELEIPWLDYENSMFFPNQKWCFKWFFEFPEVQLSPKTWFSPFKYPASRTVLLLLKSIKFPYRLLHKPQLVFFFLKLDLKNNQTILQHTTFFISKPTLLLTLNIFIHRVLTEMLSVNKMVLTTCYLLYNVYGK